MMKGEDEETEKNKPITVGVVFEGELAKRFNVVKKDSGLNANAEVLRQLVNNRYKQIKQIVGVVP